VKYIKTLILLVGQSCSGKDSIASLLEKDGYKILKSYATRPMRDREGNTHIFIKPKDVYQYKNEIIAYTKIGNYEYFSTKQQLFDADVYIIDPRGVKYLKSKVKNIKFVVIYINVSEEERRRRARNIRKDNENEIIKRFEGEKEQFDEFKINAEFDYSVKNYDVKKAFRIIKNIIVEEMNE